MTVYLAWTSEPVREAPGPWEEWRGVGDRLFLLDSAESLSTVYHGVKWLLPDDAAVLVSAVESTPKGRGLAPGTTSWLRGRTVRPR